MKKILIAVVVMIVAIMTVFIFSGCGAIAAKAVEKAIEKEAGVSIDANSGEIKATDDQGNEINIGGNKVPDGWPDVVPVSRDITVTLSGSNKSDNKTTWTISGTFSGSGEDLYNYYKSQLSGWNVDSDTNSNSEGTSTWYVQFSNDKYTSVLTITDDTKENKIIALIVGEK